MSFLARLCARSCLAIALTAGFSLSARAADGLVTVPSAFGVKQTIDKLEGVVKAGGATIFARVDHAGGATAAGLALSPPNC